MQPAFQLCIHTLLKGVYLSVLDRYKDTLRDREREMEKKSSLLFYWEYMQMRKNEKTTCEWKSLSAAYLLK